uniref:LsmAD domain-containing protein n=1 Tax=Trypanosoma congolense (strain IL3000) TaxID=1068625 RepID=G0UUI9_TRYCI|nr:conserved hypothetical protein [Trypanosoma congolense IL3000]
MSSVIRYTRPELLSLAPKPEDLQLSEEVIRKFSIIEAEPLVEPTSPDSMRHEASARKVTDAKNGPQVPPNRVQNTERFAPPARGWRGSKDQEAFEEGYKYELECNAIKKQALQETMEKELQIRGTVDSSVEEKVDLQRRDCVAASNDEMKINDNEEIERLMSSIAPSSDGGKKVAKSRFFSGANSGFQEGNSFPATVAQAFSEPLSTETPPQVKDPWALQSVVPASSNVVWNNNMDTRRPPGADAAVERSNTSSVGMGALLQGDMSLGSHGTTAPQYHGTQRAQAPAHPTLGHPLEVPGPSDIASVTTTLSARVPASHSSESAVSGQPRTWNAHDLEQRLISEQKVNKQPKVEPNTIKPIEASALEQQLLMQVQQNMVHSQGQPQPPGILQMARGATTVAGTPSLLSLSGQMTPSQLPLAQRVQQHQQQQAVPVPWGVAVQKVPPQQLPQKIIQTQPRHPGIPQPVPIIMSSAQGTPYYAQPTMPGHYVAGFVHGQGQQHMMFYRSADAAAQYTMRATGFPDNTPVLFPQQQPKQPNQRR